MVLAGFLGFLASMWVEKSLTTTDIFSCLSMHFFLFQGISTFFFRKALRNLLPGPFKNALWLADSSFLLGTLMNAILSYFYLADDGARENLAIARTETFATLLMVFAACIFVMTTSIVFAQNTREKPYLEA